MTLRLRQELAWLLYDELKGIGREEAKRVEEALSRLRDTVPEEVHPLIKELELAFLDRSTVEVEAACLIGMRWAQNPLELAMGSIDQPATEVAGTG